MTTRTDLLDHPSPTSDVAVDRAADALLDRQDVICPTCGAAGDDQIAQSVERDGAFDRVDFTCTRCGTEHPVWVG